MNGYVVSLILVLAIVLIALFIKGFQRHDPPRHHSWPEGLDTGEGSSRQPPSGGADKGGGAS